MNTNDFQQTTDPLTDASELSARDLALMAVPLIAAGKPLEEAIPLAWDIYHQSDSFLFFRRQDAELAARPLLTLADSLDQLGIKSRDTFRGLFIQAAMGAAEELGIKDPLALWKRALRGEPAISTTLLMAIRMERDSRKKAQQRRAADARRAKATKRKVT